MQNISRIDSSVNANFFLVRSTQHSKSNGSKTKLHMDRPHPSSVSSVEIAQKISKQHHMNPLAPTQNRHQNVSGKFHWNSKEQNNIFQIIQHFNLKGCVFSPNANQESINCQSNITIQNNALCDSPKNQDLGLGYDTRDSESIVHNESQRKCRMYSYLFYLRVKVDFLHTFSNF